MRNNKKIKSITFSGLTIALIVVLMFMASIVDVLDYTISAICGILVTLILVEFGTAPALSVYAGASILSILLVPNKINAILFLAFCGWYPFVKRYLERLGKIFQVISKLLVFNASLTVIYFITKAVLLIESVTVWWLVALVLLANFTFLLYDILITRLIWLYVNKYRKNLKFLKN